MHALTDPLNLAFLVTVAASAAALTPFIADLIDVFTE